MPARWIAISLVAFVAAAGATVATPGPLVADRTSPPESLSRIPGLVRYPVAVAASTPAPRPPAARHRVTRVRARRIVRVLPRVPRVRARVLALGDSVMQGATAELHRRMRSVYVDTAVGRQVSDGIRELRRLKDARRLGDEVVIHLGTNGLFTSDQFRSIMRLLAKVRRVVFVNLEVPRDWESFDNKVIAAGVRRYANARLVDWHSRWRSCPGRPFASDGYHLTSAGARCYVAYVAAAL
jgi:hypothetical protein